MARRDAASLSALDVAGLRRSEVAIRRDREAIRSHLVQDHIAAGITLFVRRSGLN